MVTSGFGSRCVGAPRSCQSIPLESVCVSSSGCVWVPDPTPAPVTPVPPTFPPVPPLPAPSSKPSVQQVAAGSCKLSVTNCQDQFVATPCSSCDNGASCIVVADACSSTCENNSGCFCSVERGSCDPQFNSGSDIYRSVAAPLFYLGLTCPPRN